MNKEYRIRIVYKDNEEALVPIEESEIKKFFDDINHGQIYLFQPGSVPVGSEEPVGFWTDISEIRYITVWRKGKKSS